MFGKSQGPGSSKYGNYLVGAGALSLLGFLAYKYYRVRILRGGGIETEPVGPRAAANEAKAKNGGIVRPTAFSPGPATATADGAEADGKDSIVAPTAIDTGASIDGKTVASLSGFSRRPS